MNESKKILSEEQIYFLFHTIVDFLWSIFLAVICISFLITSFEYASLFNIFGSVITAALSGLFTAFGVRNLKGLKASEYSYKVVKKSIKK